MKKILKPIEERVRLKTLELKNFMSYENFCIEFGDEPIHGLFGPNGCGKSSMLRAIQMLFSKFNGFDEARLKTALSKYNRNGSGKDFEVHGYFETSGGNSYEVVIGPDRKNWIWGKIPGIDGLVIKKVAKGHPEKVRKTLVEQVWFATYDKQLHQFQIEKNRWKRFKPLFEAVTGYEVEPIETLHVFNEEESKVFSENELLHQKQMSQYIFGMKIKKPAETIRENQCSDGEKKVIKHFTKLFNKPDNEIPSIVLIDNIEMHIARERQLPLLHALEGCFPDTQIIFTTHGDSVICHYDASRLTNLYYKDFDQNAAPWRKEAMRIVAIAESLMPNDKELNELMGKFRTASRAEITEDIKRLFERCGSNFVRRIKS